MQRVLVTGAGGFVGTHLIHELVSHGVDVVGVDRNISAPSEASGHVSSQAVDLQDASAVAKIDFRRIDGVIHLAALAAVGPSFEAPMQYLTTNIGIETNLFEAALRQQAKPRFLIISSGALYDGAAPLPFTERTATIPSSPYAVSKLGQEQMAHYYAQRGFECVIARPFNHIGPGQNPGFIVPDLTKQVVDTAKGRTKRILVGNLDAKRDYTDVRDIARAYRLLLAKGTPGETYNICSGVAISGHELLALIVKTVGVHPEIAEDAARMRPSENPVIYGDHAKITADTGWRPEIPLETTIKDCVADWQTR